MRINPKMITVKIVVTLQIVNTTLTRLAADALIELMFIIRTNMFFFSLKLSFRKKKRINLRMKKIASNLMSSCGGSHSKINRFIKYFVI